MIRQIDALAFVLALGATSELASAHPGIGIVVDRDGSVFYTDLKQVWRVAPDGTRSIAVPHVHTHELYLAANGDLFGEHVWYEGDATKRWGHRVWKRGLDGTIVDVIPPTVGFLEDYSFVRDARGCMYWAGDGERDAGPRLTIRKRSPDGTVTTLAGGTSGRRDGVGAAAQFVDVRWIAASPDGTVVALDSGSIRRIGPDGTVTTLASGLDTAGWHWLTGEKCHHIMGLCADAKGDVFVAHTDGQRVLKIAPDGKVTTFARSTCGFAPTGVTVAPSGDVYVLEYCGDAARARKIAADGTDRVLGGGK
jgi:hypothetical protein